MEHVNQIREKLQATKVTYREIERQTGVKYSWLAQFSINKTSGISRKGLDYVEKLERFFEEAT